MTLLAFALLVIACVEFGFVAVVLRAAPRKWDNQLFAFICGIDALTEIVRAVMLLSGYEAASPTISRGAAFLGVAISIASIEFAASFPYSKPASNRLRIFTLVHALLFVVVMIYSKTGSNSEILARTFYFIPAGLLIAGLLARQNSRLPPEDSLSRAVIIALVARWVIAIVTYGVVPRVAPDYFNTALIVDWTIAPLAVSALLGPVILRAHLFSVRGAAAEIITDAGFALGTAGVTTICVDLALSVERENIQRGLLLGVCFVPLIFVSVGLRARPWLEDRMDPRRARRRKLLSGDSATQPSDPALFSLAACEALSTLLHDGKASYVTRDALPPAIAEYLGQSGIELTRATRHDWSEPVRDEFRIFGASLIAPVRAHGKLYGAFVLKSRAIDREVVQAAWSLSAQLALRIENQRLATDLADARRLAAMGQFAAAIAHDLRTPLTSVQMNVELLRGKVSLPADDMEHFDIALSELRRANVHIADLLDFAKPVRLARVATDLHELIEDAIDSARARHQGRSLAFVCETHGERVEAEIDGQRLRQVLDNLLDNAAIASSANQRVSVRLAETTIKNSVADVIEIRDHGPGIPAKDLEHIFEPFFTTRADGTGLGLPICKKIVEAHGGEISVQSQQGSADTVGTTVTFTLPRNILKNPS